MIWDSHEKGLCQSTSEEGGGKGKEQSGPAFSAPLQLDESRVQDGVGWPRP